MVCTAYNFAHFFSETFFLFSIKLIFINVTLSKSTSITQEIEGFPKLFSQKNLSYSSVDSLETPRDCEHLLKSFNLGILR